MTGEADTPKERLKLPDDVKELARKARNPFDRGLIERGEAAPLDKDGKLPPKATHEIVGYDSEGFLIVERRRIF